MSALNNALTSFHSIELHESLQSVMGYSKWAIAHLAPIFIVTSPVTSYADQIWSIHKKRSSSGFSLDIPLIMLVASILKVFFWLGDRYDLPLLIQASIMIFVQLLLLRVALSHRPPVGAQHSLNQPFADATKSASHFQRPANFWQWRNQKPYWQFLVYFSITLTVLQVLIGNSSIYVATQGYIALSVEAILPLPQIWENQRSRSCKGFRLSVLANWIVGDVFKMTYFFLSEGSVPLAFKLCGLFQAACDAYLGIQYWMYGNGPVTSSIEERDFRLS